MSDAFFDVLFAGEIRTDSDRAIVRRRIQELFRLPEEAVERLFSGHPVTVKRGVDRPTAARFREAFLNAGAVAQIVPSPRPGRSAPRPKRPSPAPTAEGAATAAASPSADEAPLQIAPISDAPLESPAEAPPPAVDVSHLALIEDRDWTFADCTPPSPPTRVPDIDHLRLLDPDPEELQSGSGND